MNNNEKDVIPNIEWMSKRYYAACCAMQGILAFPNELDGKPYKTSQDVARLAFQFADALLKEEQK